MEHVVTETVKPAAKRYINVAYKDREMAKRLGARWDPSVKRWYCPPGSPLAKVYSWRKATKPTAGSRIESADVSMMASVVSTSQSPGGEQLSFLA